MNKAEFPPPSTPMPAVVRLPRSGQVEPYSGLKRTQLDMVTRPQSGNNYDPPVKSHIFATKGAARGVRLIDLKSLLSYLNGLANTQPGKRKKARRATMKQREAE